VPKEINDFEVAKKQEYDMIALTEKVYNKILRLPTRERVQLADILIIDLPPTSDSVDQAWLKESERRLKEYRAGKVTAIPGEEVFKNIFKKFAS
jgi:putative addiction module component (TIGR02574 family)